MNEDLRLKLYKRLKSEFFTYAEKVSALWLQKFLLVGAMIAVGVIEHPAPAASPVDHRMVVAAVVALAIILDAKMFEYALHLRLVSSYISDRFSDAPDLADCEGVLRGFEAQGHRRLLARLRSGLTIGVTVVPTMIIALLGGAFIDGATPGAVSTWTIIGVLICIVCGPICFFAWRWLFTASPGEGSSDDEGPSEPHSKAMQADAGSPRR